MKITLVTLSAVAALGLCGLAVAQAPGGYSEVQASRAAPVYANACALCHGLDMSGGAGAPGIAGPEFKFGWKGKTAADLFEYVKASMPPGQAGALSDQEYADVTALILKTNGAPAGGPELKPDMAALRAAPIPQ